MSRLRIHILDEEAGWTEELLLGDHECELLALQLDFCLEQGSSDLFARWLAQALSSALPEAVMYELRPPSEAQIKYAMAIARTLRLPLPPEVLRYRRAMHSFLAANTEAFRQRGST